MMSVLCVFLLFSLLLKTLRTEPANFHLLLSVSSAQANHRRKNHGAKTPKSEKNFFARQNLLLFLASKSQKKIQNENTGKQENPKRKHEKQENRKSSKQRGKQIRPAEDINQVFTENETELST